MATNILSVQSSARVDGSHSRQLSKELLEKLQAEYPDSTVVEREASAELPLLDQTWVFANFTPEDERSDEQRAALAKSDELVAELKAADIIVIGAPMYNFTISGALKAWIDLVARAGLTFKYTEQGPVGLLENKKAYVVITSGGVPLESPYDFTTGYMRHVLGFLGIEDVSFVGADELMGKEAESLGSAREKIAAIAA